MKASVLAMRRRSIWEAADSGILLWRRNFLLLLPFFALPVMIAGIGLYFIPNEYRWLSWVGLWWLKPFFDRLCLHVISKRFFINTEKLSVGFLHTLFYGLLGDLLWRRFSPFRCSFTPLRLMERLKSKKFEERKKSLSRGGIHFSALLSCLGLPLELFLLGGEIIFFTIMFSLFSSYSVFLFFVNYGTAPLLIYLAFCINYILVGSLYVCMGFGIYINSRVEVEGWDIELLFKKFSIKSSRTNTLKTAVLIMLFCFLFSSPLYANDDFTEENLQQEIEIEAEEKVYFPDGFLALEEVPFDILEEITASDDFGGTRPTYRVQPKNLNDEPPELPPPRDLNPWLERLRDILAHSLRIFLIIIFSILIIFLLFRLYKSRQSRKSIAFNDIDMYSNLLAAKGNPDLFFEKAQVFFEQGLFRNAWAACFCGVLNSFNLYFDVTFPKQITEYGCFSLVRERFASDSRLTEGFGSLVNNWVLLAYGARLPAQGSFEKALEYGRSLKTMQTNTGENDA